MPDASAPAGQRVECRVGGVELPLPVSRLAARVVRSCREVQSAEAPLLTAACALAFHQLSQGHTITDLSAGATVVLPCGTDASRGDRIEVEVPDALRAALASAAARGSRLVESRALSDDGACSAPLVLEGSMLSLARCRSDEQAVARALRARAGEREGAAAWSSAAADWVSGLGGRGLDELQRRAVELSLSRLLAIIAGGPGTGKTTVAAEIAAAHGIAHERLHGRPASVRLLAPTGKAAGRLTESFASAALRIGGATGGAIAGCRAQTIHAALAGESASWLRRATLVIVDEASMVDLHLMRRMLEGIAGDATLVLLGDRDQLASVEAGSVLADITEPGLSIEGCTVRLERSRRFTEQSPVGRLAASIRAGDPDSALALLQAPRDPESEGVSLVVAGREREIVEAALAFGDLHARGGAVLCAHRHGACGSLALNRALAEAACAPISDPLSPLHWEGRPVIVTQNDPAVDLLNGDVGIMQAGEDGRLWARIAGRDRLVPAALLPPCESAYALTVHKSQGSEFDEVVVVLPAFPSPILTRELLFTAVTRARRGVTVIGAPERVREALARRVMRGSGLPERLRIG